MNKVRLKEGFGRDILKQYITIENVDNKVYQTMRVLYGRNRIWLFSSPPLAQMEINV